MRRGDGGRQRAAFGLIEDATSRGEGPAGADARALSPGHKTSTGGTPWKSAGISYVAHRLERGA